MEVSKRTLWLVGIIAVLAIVFFGQRAQNHHSEAKQEARLVAICKKSVARDTFIANGFLQAADDIRARGGPDNIQRAQLYSAAAVAVARSLPQPAGLNDPLQMIEVNTVTAPDGTIRYALTDRTARLQVQGCRQAVLRSP
jgi:hypothetical protein